MCNFQLRVKTQEGQRTRAVAKHYDDLRRWQARPSAALERAERPARRILTTNPVDDVQAEFTGPGESPSHRLPL